MYCYAKGKLFTITKSVDVIHYNAKQKSANLNFNYFNTDVFL
jgi:hypothetical protein